jgi:predicted RNase H-like nuclease (RuvC/YqgF family)
MENLRVLTHLSADLDQDELPEIFTVQSKFEDMNDSSTSEHTSKYMDTDQDLHMETIKRLKSLNDSMAKEKEEVMEEFESEIKDLSQRNDELEQENNDLKADIDKLQVKVEEFQGLHVKIQELTERNRELESCLGQKNEIIAQLQESNRLLSVGSESVAGGEGLKQKVVELDMKLLETLREVEDLKNKLISVNVMYAESETQKELIIKRYNDENKSNRNSLDFWKL